MGVLSTSGSSAAHRRRRVRRVVGGLAAVIAVVATVPLGDLTASAALPAAPTHGRDRDPDKLLFFAADGAQLMVKGSDVEWAGTTNRTAKNLGVAPRADVQAIVDAANAETAELRNQVIGTQSINILRDPPRLNESAMGNLVADAMLAKYPGIDAALTNSGGLRQDLVLTPPSAGEQPGEITWGEVFAVLPFGNRTVIMTLTGAQLTEALLNGFSPSCNPGIATGRSPQVAGLKLAFHCDGLTPVVDQMALAPEGPAGPLTPIGPADTVRLVTNDFMFTGGDGYTALTGGTDVLQPGDGLLEITIEHIAADSPVAPVIEGRIVRG